jgi:hypothetical protein
MAKGNSIIVTPEPKGRFTEGTVSGTPVPGTCMELVPSTNPTGGRFSYRARSSADGTQGPIIILLEDLLLGKGKSDAYASGERCFLYFPVNGEEFNMAVRDQPGTGTAGVQNIGDLLAVDGASGMLQAAGSALSAPFTLLERGTTDETATYHRHVRYNAN